ncbi:MAG: nicotinate (nicotinamide) nucleotide adenylyltransferase [Thermoanaerobaculia bacterium]
MLEPEVSRLGVYGGSFDPIHCGHLEPVESVRRTLGLDRVLFVPAFAPPHKPSGPSASSHHRFAMAALALEPYEHFVLSDFEVARGGTTYTVETLRHLRARLPRTEIVLMLGSDTLATFDTWRSWREIVDGYRLAIIYREPFDRAHLQQSLSPELAARLAPEEANLDEAPEGATIFWGGNAPVTISSTWIRKTLPAGNLSGKVPLPVESYLRKQNLYRQD